MNIVKVNAIGDNCPIPVVKAKKAIESLTGAAIVEINVDNEIAVQNVTKMVNQKNLESTCEKLGEKNYLIKVKCGEVVESQAEEEVVTTVEKEEKIVVVLNEMSEYLSIPQMKKLQEVIIRTFTENEVAKRKYQMKNS